MKKIMSSLNVNLLILPLTLIQTQSLEEYLNEKIVLSRDKNEFVMVIGGEDIIDMSFLSYGKYKQSEYSSDEAEEIRRLLIRHGRAWLKNNNSEFKHTFD